MDQTLFRCGLGALLCSVACAPTDQEIVRGTFESLTYNVAGLPVGISKSNPDKYIPLISPLLNEYDLVLVQEDFSYHAELTRYLVHPYRSVPKEATSALVNDGLNRFARFPWEAFERQQWAKCFGDANEGSGDCLAEKGFSYARTEVSPGVWIDIYNLHAEAGGNTQDLEAREIGVRQFIEYARKKSQGNAVIIGGDTNLHLDDPPDALLLDELTTKLNLQEVCAQLSCPTDSIDRFYFRGSEDINLQAINWRLANEFVTQEGYDLSDHQAVHVSFEWQLDR